MWREINPSNRKSNSHRIELERLFSRFVSRLVERETSINNDLFYACRLPRKRAALIAICLLATCTGESVFYCSFLRTEFIQSYIAGDFRDRSDHVLFRVFPRNTCTTLHNRARDDVFLVAEENFIWFLLGRFIYRPVIRRLIPLSRFIVLARVWILKAECDYWKYKEVARKFEKQYRVFFFYDHFVQSILQLIVLNFINITKKNKCFHSILYLTLEKKIYNLCRNMLKCWSQKATVKICHCREWDLGNGYPNNARRGMVRCWCQGCAGTEGRRFLLPREQEASSELPLHSMFISLFLFFSRFHPLSLFLFPSRPQPRFPLSPRRSRVSGFSWRKRAKLFPPTSLHLSLTSFFSFHRVTNIYCN